MKHFEDFNLKEYTKKFIEVNHFTQPTPIQEDVIPSSLRGKDVIGLSATGSGKTHAFLIPILEKIDVDCNECQAVITAPTRELAFQIYEMARVMCDVLPALRVSLYVGGQDREKDIEKLNKQQPHIAIGTPGRIKDLFLNEGALRIDKAKILVVDEADMTLEYGFLDEIDAFAGRMSENLQMMAFSATMPDQLKPFIKKYMHHPVTFQIGEAVRFNPDITHVLVPCYHHSFTETIMSILPGFQPYVCLIFANTTQEAQNIANTMRENGYDLVELHSGLESRARMQAIKMIQSQKKSYIVASDIASRGIDLEGITHVISCGFPKDLKFYIHRAGRTGRATRDGQCIALYKESDAKSIQSLIKQGIEFEHMDVKNKEMVDLKPYVNKRPNKKDEFHEEVEKIVHKKKKVKPNYKKRQRQEIDRMKRKKRREMIKSDIKRQQKERAKERQRQKGMDV